MPFLGGARAGVDPFVTMADSALAAWSAALGGSRAVVPVVGLGDSIMTGRKATNFAGTSFWQRTMAALKARYGDAGQHLYCCCDSTDAVLGAPTVCDLPAGAWAFAGGGWAMSLGGLGGRCVGSATAAATATCTFVGTSFDLWLSLNGAGGPFTATIDGQAIDASGVVGGGGGNPTSAGAAGPAKVFSVAGLAPGAVHTLVLTVLANVVYVSGLTAYSGRPGILSCRFAKGGQSFYDTVKNASVGDGLKGAVENFAPAPRLVVCQHLINDVQQGNAYSVFEDGLRRLYDSAVAAQASVVHLVPYVGPQSALSGQPRMHRALEKVYLLAQRYGSAVVDMNMAWEALAPAYVGSTLLAGDGVHPSDAGHADIAQRLLAVIAP